jgi:nucleoside-diphosphate-sugar epimerase
MKLAITGAFGHIGSRVIHGISPGEFEEVLLIDNMSTQRYCSIFNLPQGIPFRFIEGDITSIDLPGLLRGKDVVLHLAAITDAASSFSKRDEVFRINLTGTELVAKACIKNGCSLLFPSTTSVYGVQTDEVDENCPEEGLKPQSPYAESKLQAEKLLADLGQSDGLRFLVCRLGTIFGKSIGMRFHTAINKFCWQATVGQPITVWKTALHQKRPYLDLGDAVQAIRHIIGNQLFHNTVYNVVTINSTVNDIIAVIRKYVPGLSVTFVDTEIMNQLSYQVSNRKFTETGFAFNGDLVKAVKETVDLLQGVMNRKQGTQQE